MTFQVPKFTYSPWAEALTVSQAKELQDFILDSISSAPAEHLSTSYLVKEIRLRTRFRFPTQHSAAMETFEALGFKIIRIAGKNPRRGCPIAWHIGL